MANLSRGLVSVKRLTAISRQVAIHAQSWVTENLFGVQGVVHGTPPDTTSVLRTPVVTRIAARPAFAQTVFVTNLLLTTLAGTSVSVTPATATVGWKAPSTAIAGTGGQRRPSTSVSGSGAGR